MKELQKHADELHRDMGWRISRESFSDSKAGLLTNYMLLTTEVAEVAEEFRKAFNRTNAAVKEGMNETEAFEAAKKEIKEDVGKELADCLAYITKIANYFEIDLEESFYAKMEEVRYRKNKDI